MIASLRARPLLFDAFPDLASALPWTPLAHVPTAVEPMAAIAPWLGRTDGVFMKRDDLVSPLYGGNKVRRYEFVLADAKAKGKTRLVTVGGLASTQAMATALFGKALGFAVRVVLFDQPITEFARESIRGYLAAGAELIYGGGYAMTAARALSAQRRDHGENYFIFPGAAEAISNLGYVDGLFELAGQVERHEAPRPDVIVLPTGSSGTLAALALGAAYLGWETEIIGVRITTPLATNRLTVGGVIRNTDRYLEKHAAAWRPMRNKVRYRLFADALGRGYGYPTPAALEGAAQVPNLIGATGEITYSGKALAALRVLVNEERYRAKSFLFWNTLSHARPVLPAFDEGAIPRALRFVFESSTVA